jgi:hypothetical protein
MSLIIPFLNKNPFEEIPIVEDTTYEDENKEEQKPLFPTTTTDTKLKMSRTEDSLYKKSKNTIVKVQLSKDSEDRTHWFNYYHNQEIENILLDIRFFSKFEGFDPEGEKKCYIKIVKDQQGNINFILSYESGYNGKEYLTNKFDLIFLDRYARNLDYDYKGKFIELIMRTLANGNIIEEILKIYQRQIDNGGIILSIKYSTHEFNGNENTDIHQDNSGKDFSYTSLTYIDEIGTTEMKLLKSPDMIRFHTIYGKRTTNLCFNDKITKHNVFLYKDTERKYYYSSGVVEENQNRMKIDRTIDGKYPKSSTSEEYEANIKRQNTEQNTEKKRKVSRLFCTCQDVQQPYLKSKYSKFVELTTFTYEEITAMKMTDFEEVDISYEYIQREFLKHTTSIGSLSINGGKRNKRTKRRSMKKKNKTKRSIKRAFKKKANKKK